MDGIGRNLLQLNVINICMRLRSLIEAPVEDYTVMGDFTRPSRSWKPTDRRILPHPSNVRRVKNFFRNSPFDIRMWIVHSKDATKYADPQVGIVSIDWLKVNMPDIITGLMKTPQGLDGLGSDSINIIYTNNTGTQWIPLTPWMMAHRMGHAIFQPEKESLDGLYTSWEVRKMYDIDKYLSKTIDEILQVYNHYNAKIKYYNDFYRKSIGYIQNTTFINRLLCAIGTTKACREGKIDNGYEFIYECFAKYLITGKLKFNPPPDKLLVSHSWGRPQYTNSIDRNEIIEVGYLLQHLADMMETEFSHVLHHAVGKIMVM
jgi:hypothetical protein